MADKKPKTTVESAPKAREHSERPADESEDAHKQKQQASAVASEGEAEHPIGQVRRSFNEWLEANYPGHEHAFVGGATGFVVALLVFAIGFWATLLIVVFVIAGIAIGQYFDGNPQIAHTIRRLFEESHE
ncbi:MAG: DUF2273 domain-containing protein [Atopobiaceae bacterium]|jgi:uncharacterized membrane protein|nr:DUF2273 domain-containing protein [Olegusella sp.]